jgi:hypothetical protein
MSRPGTRGRGQATPSRYRGTPTGQLGPFPSRLSYALDAVPEGTRVTNSVELELGGPGRLLGRVAVPRVRDAVAANLQKLKELLEQ